MKSRKKEYTFVNSELGRAKPRKGAYEDFEDVTSDMGLTVDRTSSATVVRIIVGLLLLHLIIIGGVLMHGKVTDSVAAVKPSMTPPPLTPVKPVVETKPAVAATPAPQPAPQPAAQPAPAAPAPTHITQVTAAPAAPAPAPVEVVQPATPAPAVAAQPAPAPAPAPAAPAQDARHHVRTGDTLTSIAGQYGVSVEAIRQANPSIKNDVIFQGQYITVPAAGSAQALTGASVTGEAAVDKPRVSATRKVHVLKSGETLARVARQYGVSVPALMKINKLTEKDTRRLRPGREIVVSE